MRMVIYENTDETLQIYLTKSRRAHQMSDDSHKNTDPCSNPAWVDSAQSIRADSQCLERSGSGPSVQTTLPLCCVQARRPISINPLTTRKSHNVVSHLPRNKIPLCSPGIRKASDRLPLARNSYRRFRNYSKLVENKFSLSRPYEEDN